MILDLDKDREELKKLEIESSKEGFWDNSTKAQEVMQRSGLISNRLKIWDELAEKVSELSELMANTTDSEKEMVTEIENSLDKTQAEFEALEFELTFDGPHDKENAIISISAGSGGVDAQDWAEMLLRMYIKFAEAHDFKPTILHKTDGEEAGIKSASMEIKGDHAYGYLKSEYGVHRLVRISPYDADKARHTSFALVEIIPEIPKVEYEIDSKDLRIDVFRSGGHGGQSVNTTDSAVRITHIPTGLTATCQNERSQLQNKEMAMAVLKSKLIILDEKNKEAELAKLKGKPISAEWGNQIRSYVLQPYTLVKDHRTDYESADVQKVLGGGLDEFIEAYLRNTHIS